MGDTQTRGLLVLPTELRLEVYQYLVVNCLAEGRATDIAGIYLSCREIYAELNADFILKARPLLLAKHRWNQISEGGAPMRMDLVLDTRQSFRGSAIELSIKIPVLKVWLDDSKGETPDDFESFCHMVEGIRPLFCLPWSVLTLGFYDASGPLTSFDHIDDLFFGVLYCLHEFASRRKQTEHALQQTNRLVLTLPNYPNDEWEFTLRPIWETFIYMRRVSRHSETFAHVKNGWICKGLDTKEPGWRFIIDFTRDLEAPERASWKFYKSGGLLKSRRIPIDGQDADSDYDTMFPEESIADSESET